MRIERLMFFDQAFFVKPECLFELNQDLFGLPMTVLLLKDQATEQATPDQAREQDEDGVEGCQSILVWT
jgi:hypothetical protein